MSKSAIPSPARSNGAAPRRHKPRRTLSEASPARSDTSAKLVSVIEPYINIEKFVVSPMGRRSVLPDDTEIEAPRRASWWKRVEGSYRDVLEALDTNKMPVELPFEEEVEVENEKQSQSLPESSDNESVTSIVVPQRRLFQTKPQPPSKFGEMIGSRKSLGRSNLDDDNTIYHLPKNLFNKDKSRNRPEFPAALLNSTNKTFNKTIEPDINERQGGRNLFGQAGIKRKKNMFTDFVMSESEDDSEIQHKVFGFKKNDNKRISSEARKIRMPSLTPSVTTDIDMDDWNLLPSSTMIGNGSGQLDVSIITNNDESEKMEIENQDITLTEENHNTSTTKNRSLNRTRFSKSKKYEDEFDKTLTNEDIEVEQASEKLDNGSNKTNSLNKSQHRNELSKNRKDQSLAMEIKDKVISSETEKKDKEQLMEKTISQVRKSDHQSHIKEKSAIGTSVAEQLNEEYVHEHTQQIEPTVEHQKSIHEEQFKNLNQDEDMDKMEWIDNDQDNVNGDVDNSKKLDEQDSFHEKTNKEISHEEKENENDGEDNKSNEQDGTHEQTSKEVSHDDEENEHDNEDSLETNNGSEEQVNNEDKANEQDDKSNADTINEPSADVSDDNNDAEDTENEEMNDEASENDDPNDVEKSEGLIEDEDEQDGNNKNESESAVSNNVNTIKSLVNASHTNVESPVEDVIDHEDDVVEETPNSSYDTTGQNRKKDATQVNCPEAVLQNTSDISFRPIGRSTSFRKSKIVIDDVNLRHTLIPIQESITSSDGSRNSSTEGSGWDSHRTTRKTLRQTFGKDFTPRKSLRALVMEKSAKRQTESDKNASKMNNIANKTDNKYVLEDLRIRDKRVSNRNMSSDQLPHTKSPALGISTHHVSDPQISKPRVSNSKSVQEINEAESLNREEFMNITDQVQAPDDSGPEISMHASYGSGMSAVASHQESKNISVKKSLNRTANKSAPVKQARIEADIQEQEELDYDPSLQDSTNNSSKDKSNSRNVEQQEIEESEKEESEPEESDQEMEAESENEAEESEQEIEPHESQENADLQESEEVGADQSQEDIQDEMEQEQQSEQEMEESEHEESQQEIEVESDREESQQEIENESDDDELDQNVSQGSVNNITQEESDPRCDRDSDEQSREMDSEPELDNQEDSVHIESPSQSERQTERIIFDNELSDQEIDYELSERVSRQITNDDISEQVTEDEMEEINYSRHSDQAENQNLSLGTKKSLMMIQMEKIAQENMDMRLKIREKIQNSLKQQQNINRFMSPIPSKFSIGRMKKPEPIKPKRKPRKPVALLMGPLPKEFMEDLKYKPPKRFQPASAPWITKRLYNFLESKLEPKYDYRARVRAEKLVQNIYNLTKLARRHQVAPQGAVDELKSEMARLNVVTTHFDFYEFFHEFMPREVRVKVNPDIVNKIPMPRKGVFSDILQSQQAEE